MAQMISTKRLQIDKANATVTLVVALASFLTVGSLVMTRGLLVRRSYQARVASEKKIAANRLEENLKAVSKLQAAYTEFVGQDPNIIGGLKGGSEGEFGERDGDNAKITLDALPSKYDFPAVTTSLEKLLTQRNFKIESIDGIDDEIAQKDKVEADPAPVDMPFEFVVSSTYDPITDFLKVLETSIRPFHIQTLTLTAKDKAVELEVEAKTYYLPEKTLNITTKAIR
jgi:hypothetical protein